MLLSPHLIRATPFLDSVYQIINVKTDNGFLTRSDFNLLMAQFFHLSKKQSKDVIVAMETKGLAKNGHLGIYLMEAGT